MFLCHDVCALLDCLTSLSQLCTHFYFLNVAVYRFLSQHIDSFFPIDFCTISKILQWLKACFKYLIDHLDHKFY